MNTRRMLWFEWLRSGMLIGLMALSASAVAQESPNRTEPPSPGAASGQTADEIRELREQVRELQAAVAGMRSDWQQARAETADLRRELDEIRAGSSPQNAVLKDAVASVRSNADAAVSGLQSALPSGAH